MCPPARAPRTVQVVGGARYRSCVGSLGRGIFRPGVHRGGRCFSGTPYGKLKRNKREFHGGTTEANRRDQSTGQPPERKTCAALLLRHLLCQLFSSLNLSRFCSQDLIRGLSSRLTEVPVPLHAGGRGRAGTEPAGLHPQSSACGSARYGAYAHSTRHPHFAAKRSIFVHRFISGGCVNMLRIVLEVRGERMSFTASG